MATLTVVVDDELLRKAERLAAARKTTVPAMVERLLQVISQPAPSRDDLPPATRRAYGMLPSLSDDEVERILDEERTRKYGGA
jgi:hypothetical protein